MPREFFLPIPKVLLDRYRAEQADAAAPPPETEPPPPPPAAAPPQVETIQKKTILDVLLDDQAEEEAIVKAFTHLCNLEVCLRSDMENDDPTKTKIYEARIEECKSLRDQFRPKLTPGMSSKIPFMDKYKNSLGTDILIKNSQKRISDHELF